MRGTLTLAGLLAAAAAAEAQPHPDSLPAGARVRLGVAGKRGVYRTAVLDSVRRDTLFLRGTEAVPRSAVGSLAVHRRRRRVWSGAAVGALWGAGVGAAFIGSVALRARRRPPGDYLFERPVAEIGVPVARLAVAVGAVVGAVYRPERWVRVSGERPISR